MAFINPVEEFAKAGEAVDKRWEAQKEDEAFQKLSELAQDPQYQGQPVSQFLETAGTKALQSGAAKFGLKMMNEATLAQTREAVAAEHQVQAEERQLDKMYGAVQGLKSIKDPTERAVSSVAALKAVASNMPPEQRPMIDKAIADIQQNPQKADAYLNYFENAFKTSKRDLTEKNLLLKGAQIEIQALKAQNEAIRDTRNDAQKQVGFLSDYGQPVPKSLARTAGMNIPEDGTDMSKTSFSDVKNKIMSSEGSAATGGYNSVAYNTSPTSNAAGVQPPKPVTQMTLGELYNWQQNEMRPKTKGQRGKEDIGSTGVGAYQFESETLKEQAQKLFGKDWQNKTFSPEVQDQLAEKLFDQVKANPAKLATTWKTFGKQEPGSDTILLTKQTASGREGRYQDVQAIAINEAQQAIRNISEMPVDVSSGVWGAGRKEVSLLDAPINALIKNPLTKESTASYNAEIDNMGKFFARMMSGGLQVSKDDADSYTSQFRIPEGAKPLTVLTKMAQMRQSFEKMVEVKLLSKSTPEEQKQMMREGLQEVKRLIPMTVSDVNKLRNSRNPRATLGDAIKKASEELANRTSATTDNSITVNGTTYKRPANFSDDQWNAYKKSQGVGQ